MKKQTGSTARKESLGVRDNQPAPFSFDDALAFQLAHQTAEVLRGDGEQLSHLPILQRHLHLSWSFFFGPVLDLDQIPEELLQAFSSGEGTLFADVEHAGI